MKKPNPFFDNISPVMEELATKLGLHKGLKINTICKLWPKVVGPRFEKTSKIFSIQQNGNIDVALIAVSSSVVGQELGFFSNDILRKLHKIGENFGFNIRKIKFSTQHWTYEEKQEEKLVQLPSDGDLEEIELSAKTLDSLRNTINENDMLNEEMKERFFRTAVKDLKTQMWLEKQETSK